MKVLIVGLGSIAKKHIKAIRQCFESCEIYAIRSGLSSHFIEDVVNIYSLDEVPSDLDFSIVSNPTSSHFDSILELSKLNKPIFIEKPVLNTLDGHEELLKRLKERQIKTYVGCNLRFHPIIAWLKKELANKRPIEMNIYCGSYLPDWHPDQDYRKLYSADSNMGGGVHLDLIHELDYTVYLMGLPKASSKYTSKKSTLEIESEDIAHYILDYSNTTVFITLNYYRTQPKRQIECVWESGVWIADLLGGNIINDKGEVIFETDFNVSDTYQKQLLYFWNQILENNDPMNSFDEAIDVLKLCLN